MKFIFAPGVSLTLSGGQNPSQTNRVIRREEPWSIIPNFLFLFEPGFLKPIHNCEKNRS